MPRHLPGRLTAEQQQQALAEWGSRSSYRCCACTAECALLGTAIDTAAGLRMGCCHACLRRMTRSPAYRRLARANAQAAALRALWQRVADLVGVTGAALLAALSNHLAMPEEVDLRMVDQRLQLPRGSVETAVAYVMSARPSAVIAPA